MINQYNQYFPIEDNITNINQMIIIIFPWDAPEQNISALPTHHRPQILQVHLLRQPRQKASREVPPKIQTSHKHRLQERLRSFLKVTPIPSQRPRQNQVHLLPQKDPLHRQQQRHPMAPAPRQLSPIGLRITIISDLWRNSSRSLKTINPTWSIRTRVEWPPMDPSSIRTH